MSQCIKIRFRLRAMLMILMLAGLPAYGQSGSDLAATSPAQPSTPSSPLDGNWYIAGNRQERKFPVLSTYLKVDGTQIIGHGYVQAACPDDSRNGAGGNVSLQGEIAPDGVFTLRNGPQNTIHVEISGQVPAERATTWSGKYRLTGDISRKCSSYRQTNSFTATLFAPLNGTFSGLLNDPKSHTAKFSITIKQGDATSRILKDGRVHFYLPLTATIQVKGSSCFSHGFADPLTYSTHGSLPSRFSTLGGDALDLWFAMDDESQLTLIAVFAEPGESALSVLNARVIGGKCDHQSFTGMLRQR